MNRSRDPLLSLSANRSTDHRHFTEAFRGGSSTFLLFLTFSFFVFRFHVYASFSNNLDQKSSRPSRDTAHNTLRKPRVRRFNEQRFLLYTEYTPHTGCLCTHTLVYIYITIDKIRETRQHCLTTASWLASFFQIFLKIVRLHSRAAQ